MIDFSLIQWVGVVAVIGLLAIWYFHRKSGKDLAQAESRLDESTKNLRNDIKNNLREAHSPRHSPRGNSRPSSTVGRVRRSGLDDDPLEEFDEVIDTMANAAIVGTVVAATANAADADAAEEMIKESIDRVVDREIHNNEDFSKPERTYTPSPRYEPDPEPSRSYDSGSSSSSWGDSGSDSGSSSSDD